MNLEFYKYQGTGNHFIMIDNRIAIFPKENKNLISQLCDRNFGVGADGIILIENDTSFDFKIIYFNADGSQTFCGNGGRCAVAFAKYLKLITSETTFIAVDGVHFAAIKNGIVSLKMIDVSEIKVQENSVFLYTGTQHHVELVDNLEDFPVFEKGKKIRNSYDTPGSNVNFVAQIDNATFRVRTYEKGVEDETFACGTGVTAVAIAMYKTQKTASNFISLLVEGGNLEVSFTEKNGTYTNVFLKGAAAFIFKGNITI